MKYLKRRWTYFGYANIFLLLLLVFSLLFAEIFLNYKVDIDSNYKSVDFTNNMSQSLAKIYTIHSNYFFNTEPTFNTNSYAKIIEDFRLNFEAEANNITEKGEQEKVNELRVKFDNYILLFSTFSKSNNRSKEEFFSKFIPMQTDLNALVLKIYSTNYYAIISKNKSAHRSVNVMIISMIIIFEIILIFVLTNFAKYAKKNEGYSRKESEKRNTSSYPKFFPPKE